MIRVKIYWDGFYQGEIKSPVRLQQGDIVYGMLFQNITTGEKFKIIVASELEVSLYDHWQDRDDHVRIYQNVNVVRLE